MSFTNVNEATHWLLNQVNPVPRPDMSKIYQALAFVGNPHLHLPVIHITGTNGKGSTVAYLAQLLTSQGLRVGTFTSPHIERFNERIAFNGEQISDEDLIRFTNRLVELNHYMDKESPYGRLIYFELFTIMMCLYFQEKQPDVCLIEAGIGGMSDCTNVLDGQIAVISSVGMDHADMLGDTLEAIALEKAGIIKTNKEIVTGRIEARPLAVIRKWSQAKRAQQFEFNRHYGVTNLSHPHPFVSRFDFWSDDLEQPIKGLEITMLGDHQIRNAALSLQVFIRWMAIQEQVINWQSAQQALKQTAWIGRLESLQEAPYVFLDGAHNMEGLTALKEVVAHKFADYHVDIIYGGLKKKNQADQVPLLLTYPVQSVQLTSFHHFEAMQAEDFEAILHGQDHPGKRVAIVEDWQTWLDHYLETFQGQSSRLLLITGSLYFVSEARAYLISKNKIK